VKGRKMQLPKGFSLREGATLSGPLPRTVSRIIEYLETVKAGELITTYQLAVALRLTTGTVQAICAHPALMPFRYSLQARRIVWGGKRTISELKKQLEKA